MQMEFKLHERKLPLKRLHSCSPAVDQSNIVLNQMTSGLYNKVVMSYYYTFKCSTAADTSHDHVRIADACYGSENSCLIERIVCVSLY